jgi:D-alanine-D-alanine ligase-like ATP-grasp enzyme
LTSFEVPTGGWSDGKTICFDGLPRPAGPEALSLYWMDNKPAMRKRFMEAGIPVAKGGSAFSEKQALEIFHSLRKPVIVKPHSGSRSRHTTIHIEKEEEFARAFWLAKMLSPFALIEEELSGMVHRGTLIGGKLVGVIRREPPHVVGDGTRTVRELVAMENRNEKRHGATFHEITTGHEAEAELARQKLAWESIPREGVLVTLNQKVSRGIGASNTDVTDTVHPENRKLLERIGEVLKDPLVGVDFIMDDVRVPWREQERSGVIECNSLPFIDLHHYPLYGKPRNVAGALWDLIFPDSARV